MKDAVMIKKPEELSFNDFSYLSISVNEIEQILHSGHIYIYIFLIK